MGDVGQSIVHYNISKWIDENNKYFLPPVCNKMMHREGQLKVFYVGGPNIRKDFHIEEGEEFFYMRNGDMNLRCQVGDKFRDVIIKEGEVFMLPAKVPHSPQRYEDTVGLVIERERLQEEKDCLRYFVGDTTERLFEKWFYCDDLGTQLGPVIKEYFSSEQHRTGKPIPGTIPENPPFEQDALRTLEEPFPLKSWINKHREEINSAGRKQLFSHHQNYQSDIEIVGKGKGKEVRVKEAETFLWQLEGSSEILVEGKKVKLVEDESLLIEANASYQHNRGDGSITLSLVMNPNNKARAFKHLNKN